jgi:uncharacterized membrane protein YtjA (UPF0391 family)
MNFKWTFLALVIIVGVALFTSPSGQQQALAKFLFFCIVAAFVVKPVGLFIGKTLNRLMKKE